MFYSKSTGGFYNVEVNGVNIPEDAVSITEQHYADLMAGQTSGQVIMGDSDGSPYLSPAPSPTSEQLAIDARQKRDSLISETDWTVLADAPLTTAQKNAWKAYRQALRDVPSQSGFPDSITWPVKPT